VPAAGEPSVWGLFERCAYRNPLQTVAFMTDITIRRKHVMGRGILLWLLGIPIPVIIILALLFR
jgi:hypothetical protein